MSSANQPALQSSNSTAHIFLGGARPAWMNAFPSSSADSPPGAFRTRPSGLPIVPPPPPRPARNLPPPPLPPPPPPSSLFPIPIQSPPPPSASAPHLPPSPAKFLRSIAARSAPPRALTTPLDLSQPQPCLPRNAAGPAPVPASHPTPSLPRAMTPSTTDTPTEPPRGRTKACFRISAGPASVSSSRPGPSWAPAMTPSTTAGTSTQITPPTGASSRIPNPAVRTTGTEPVSVIHNRDNFSGYPPRLIGDPAYFSAAYEKWQAFDSDPSRHAVGSVALENARIRLLRDALQSQDIIYLVIHQLYSLATYAPAELSQLRDFSGYHFEGLKALGQLLVENGLLSPRFLQWAVYFPEPVPKMLCLPWWSAALSQAMAALVLLGRRWNAFEQHIRERGLPPLVEELISNFGLRSPVLHQTIFLALTRRIPHPNKQEGRLSEIFRHDAALTEDRLALAMTEAVPLSRACMETDMILTLYHVNMGYPPTNTPPSLFGSPSIGASGPPHPGKFIHSPGRPGVLPLPTPPPVGLLSQISPISPISPAAAVSAPQQPLRSPALTPPMARMSVTAPPPRPVPAPTVTPPTQAQPRPRPTPVQAEAAQQAILTMRQTSRPGLPSSTPRKTLASTLLLPSPGKTLSANTMPPHPRDALHQAHLRDPVHQLIKRGPAGEVQEAMLFQYLDSFALTPTPLGRFECQFHWSFNLTQEDAGRLPAPAQMSSGELPHHVRVLMDGQQLYRLRCVSVSPKSKLPIDESTWSLADCVWPSVIYIFVNDTELFVRRKHHHAKDLPLDITSHLRPGENKISLHFIRDADEQKDKLYAIAVEIAQISARESVIALAQTLCADDTRRRIHQRLEAATSHDDNDDDLHVVSDDLVINLVDPFTARVFQQPVRGRSCLHSECFDHETFIHTRAATSGQRPLPNDWRCPICRLDARPQMLVRDEFMADVHKELLRTNQLHDARAIRVARDGSWTVVTEADLPTAKRSSRGLDSPVPKRQKVDTPETVSQVTQTVSEASAVIALD